MRREGHEDKEWRSCEVKNIADLRSNKKNVYLRMSHQSEL